MPLSFASHKRSWHNNLCTQVKFNHGKIFKSGAKEGKESDA